ncbi:hypothetical protein D3C75_1127980 [compost metagenome]
MYELRAPRSLPSSVQLIDHTSHLPDKQVHKHDSLNTSSFDPGIADLEPLIHLLQPSSSQCAHVERQVPYLFHGMSDRQASRNRIAYNLLTGHSQASLIKFEPKD